MRRHEGHIRQRSKRSYELRYNKGTDPLTGQRQVITSTFRGSYIQAKAELQRILKAAHENAHVEPSKIKVDDFLKQWLATIESQLSPKTHERYTQIVELYLIPTFGNALLTKLVPSIIQVAFNKLETTGRRDGKEGGLAPRTRLHIHRTFKSALKHAVQLQMISRNPADAVRSPRAKKITITTLTVDQSATLLESIKEKSVYWPVLIALTTGMRRGEIMALKWKNIDFEKKTIRVVESLEQTKKGIRFKAPKTERTRAILLPDYAVDQLRTLKHKQEKSLRELEITQNNETLVCCRYDGEPLYPSSVTHEFIKAIKKLPNLPRVRFHDLRHSHATQLLTEGIHPKIAQERLGHSTITTTLDLYSHVTDTMQDDAATKINNALRLAFKKRAPQGPQLG